jgi:hypothetical protein
LEFNMKTILAMTMFTAALAFGFCNLASAEDAKADPVGTWKCEYKIGDQQRTSTLTITKEGDKLAGKMDWPDQKDEKLDRCTIDSSRRAVAWRHGEAEWP